MNGNPKIQQEIILPLTHFSYSMRIYNLKVVSIFVSRNEMNLQKSIKSAKYKPFYKQQKFQDKTIIYFMKNLARAKVRRTVNDNKSK